MKRYSPTINAFYDTDINDDIPADAVDISEEIWSEMLNGQSQGMEIKSDLNGNPSLVERAWSNDEMLMMADAQKSALRTQADLAIAPLQYAVALGIATDAEKDELRNWQQYCVFLNRVDTSLVPNIDWPIQPN